MPAHTLKHHAWRMVTANLACFGTCGHDALPIAEPCDTLLTKAKRLLQEATGAYLRDTSTVKEQPEERGDQRHGYVTRETKKTRGCSLITPAGAPTCTRCNDGCAVLEVALSHKTKYEALIRFHLSNGREAIMEHTAESPACTQGASKRCKQSDANPVLAPMPRTEPNHMQGEVPTKRESAAPTCL